jgi:processive 1,2-diacylglycerol beta-glucosyltransferase
VPRALLLTSTLGSGHARAAQAIDVALRGRLPGAETATLDFWSLMDREAAYGVQQTYLRLVRTRPELYEYIYGFDRGTWRDIVASKQAPPAHLAELMALMPGSRERRARAAAYGPHSALDRVVFPLGYMSLAGRPRGFPRVNRLLRVAVLPWVWRQLVTRLQARLEAFRPDVIIVTQANLAVMLAFLKDQRRWDIPTVGVLTDFGLHDFSLQDGIDRYCIAHESVELPDGIDRTRVLVTGMPLMPGFARPPSVEESRRELGLDHGRAVVLVLGGGLGLGVEAAAEQLLASSRDIQLLVMAGRNGAVQALRAGIGVGRGARVRVLGWTERMEVPMRAADIIVGKPGGLSVAEALACGRPLVCARVLNRQERFNSRFLETHNVGRLVPERDLGAYVASVLTDTERLAQMQARAARLGKRDGADRVAERAWALAHREGGSIELQGVEWA